MKKKLTLERKLLESILKKGITLLEAQENLKAGAILRLLRLNLSMTIRHLAKRAKVPPSTISRIEKLAIHPNEETLRKIFNALECDIAFLPIPRFQNIEAFLQEKAKKIAEKRLSYLEGTMALEKQLPDEKWRKRLLESEIEELLRSPSQLWDEDETS